MAAPGAAAATEPAPRVPAPRVAVFGSANLDLIVRCGGLPEDGETVLASGAAWSIGGKGANQAVAAARAGAGVVFVGAVGASAEGLRLRRFLEAEGIDVVLRDVGDAPAGMAVILVAESGENRIVVVPGANASMDEAQAHAARDRIAASHVLVVQGELPARATRAAVRLARDAGVRTLINLAPVVDLGAELACADPLVVNEIEAGQLLGVRLRTLGQILAAAPRLLTLARSVVVTVGAEGAVLITADGAVHVPAPRVAEVRDTTGAGDAAAGVLAAALAGGLPLVESTRLAVAAGSMSVTVEGAGQNYPDFRSALTELRVAAGGEA